MVPLQVFEAQHIANFHVVRAHSVILACGESLWDALAKPFYYMPDFTDPPTRPRGIIGLVKFAWNVHSWAFEGADSPAVVSDYPALAQTWAWKTDWRVLLASKLTATSHSQCFIIKPNLKTGQSAKLSHMSLEKWACMIKHLKKKERKGKKSCRKRTRKLYLDI